MGKFDAQNGATRPLWLEPQSPLCQHNVSVRSPLAPPPSGTSNTGEFVSVGGPRRGTFVSFDTREL